MSEEELLNLIKQAKRESWTELDLSGQYLRSLPPTLGELQQLKVLKLGWNETTRHCNYLTVLPDSMAHLVNLESLDLSYNILAILPDWMAQLDKLHSLDLRSTQMMVVPQWIEKLVNLRSLDLGYNRLTELPDWMDQFTKLQALDLGNNDLSLLPDWIAKLASLQSLDLRGNKLTSLPDWMADANNLPQLQNIYIRNNPWLEPPPEFIDAALASTQLKTVDAIRSYFRQLREESSVYFYESKLLIIGESGAGKTSLARKLQEPNCPLANDDESTEGIDILAWQFALPLDAKDDRYRVNIWDFGGQVIYFATHQFFLTKRSVYVLVVDTRREHIDFYSWLRMQETFGGSSPVLLVKNCNRKQGNSFNIENLPQLRASFPNLQEEVIELDLGKVPGDLGWSKLLHHLQRHLLNLPHITQPRPKTWVDVRKAIASDPRDVINWQTFVGLCREQSMKGEEDIQLLGEYLHNLGDILYFHEDPILRDHVILKPMWGLEAVYKVLKNSAIEKQMGKFSRDDLRKLWNTPIYDGYQNELLRLMENFQLCYPLADIRDIYIAPQLLNENIPEYGWDANENLQLRYVYPVFMPRGILSRAIVKLHKRIEDQRLVWRSGVILSDGYARGELLELRGEKEIRVRISGNNKRELFMEVVRTLDELHQGFPKLPFKRHIPCNCAACRQRSEPHFYELEKLYKRLSDHVETIECQLAPYHHVSVRGMLDENVDMKQQTTCFGDTMVFIDRLYQGGHHEGDIYDIGNIKNVTGMTIGDNATATVINSGNRIIQSHSQQLSTVEKEELEQLTQRKVEIERPLRKWARAIKYLYIFTYIVLIIVIWWFLDQLVQRRGWDKLEPLTWVISTVFGIAGPLLVWLSAENLSPSAIEQQFLEYWSTIRLVREGFDLVRYKQLIERQKSSL